MIVSKDLSRQLSVAAVGVVATVGTQRLLAVAWKAVTGKPPPKFGDSNEPVGGAVTWAVASSIGIVFARLFAQRLADRWLTRLR